MSGKFITTWFCAPLDTYEKEVGLVFKETKEYYTQRNVNLDAFALQLKVEYEQLDANGYDVINVIPISVGQSENCYQSNNNYIGDVGFSITRGAVVVGKKRS